MVNRNIRLFLIPMRFCTFVLLDFCAFGLLSFLLSPPACLSFWIFIQDPLSIVFVCVRDVFNFELMDEEELLEILYSYGSLLCFDTYCFLRIFWLLFAFWLSIPGMGSFKYNIPLPCFLSMDFCCHPLRHF